jgi:UDP-N-acetylmuramate--alanine ligase
MMQNNVGEAFSIDPDMGNIFLSGIGGIGMSAIAEILHKLGYKVQGSDQAKNANVERLEKLGIKICLGQKAENIVDAAVIVRSSAIRMENPELVAAKAKNVPIIDRAEMLAEIMKLKKCVTIAGSHGKTTTTSMVAALFAESMPGTTVVNGGILNSCNSNAYFGEG